MLLSLAVSGQIRLALNPFWSIARFARAVMPLNRAQRRRVRALLWRGAQAESPPDHKTPMEAILRQCAEIQHTQVVNRVSMIQNMQMQAATNGGDMEALTSTISGLSSTIANDLHDLAQTTATQAQVEQVLARLKMVIDNQAAINRRIHELAQKQERTWDKVLSLDAKMNALRVQVNHVRNEAFDPHRYPRRHS